MKIAALVTTLVLGTSGLALADNGFHKPARPGSVEMHRNRWENLGETKLGRGGRAVLDVSTKQRFATLKLDARGSVFVDKILITYGNGEKQVVEVNRNLGGRGTAATIDLEGRTRQIDKIAIIGKAGRFASVSIQAS